MFAEYAKILLCAHALFCAMIRLPMLSSDLTVLAGLTASLWVVFRFATATQWRWWFPLVTLGGTVGLYWFQFATGQAEQTLLDAGPFSTVIVFSMLLIVWTMDAAESIVALRTSLQVRSRLTAFVLQHGLRCLLWGTMGLILAWSIAVPLIQEAIYQQSAATAGSKLAMDRMTPAQSMLFRFTESMSALCFFVIGSCVGSFLNVVIYRVPAGISVLAKASHCPVCQTKIASHDNLPLIGWLKLRGQCRNCGTSISSRYPSVELTIGLMFLLLYFVELISGGTNLPGRMPNHYAGVLWILFYTKWDLVSLYLFHCFVFCSVFSWTMIGRDGNRVPLKAALITIGLAVSAVLLSPHLLPWTEGGILSFMGLESALSPLVAASDRLFSGAVTGLLAGWMTCRFCRLPFQPAIWLLIGMTLGGRTAVVVGLLCLVVSLLSSLTKTTAVASLTFGEGAPVQKTQGTTPSISAWWLLPVALLFHHCLWRQIASIAGGAG